jgi:hypothetical protein
VSESDNVIININGKQYDANTVKNLLIIIYKFINFKSMSDSDKANKYGTFLQRIGKTVMRLRGERDASNTFLVNLLNNTTAVEFEAITRSNIREFTNILYDIRFEAEQRELELLTKADAYFKQRFGSEVMDVNGSIQTQPNARLTPRPLSTRQSTRPRPDNIASSSSSSSTTYISDAELENLRIAALNLVQTRETREPREPRETREREMQIEEIVDQVEEVREQAQNVQDVQNELLSLQNTDANEFNSTGQALSTTINRSLNGYIISMTEYENSSEAYGDLILKARLAQKRAQRAAQRAAQRGANAARQAAANAAAQAAQQAVHAAQAAQAAAQRAAQRAANAARQAEARQAANAAQRAAEAEARQAANEAEKAETVENAESVRQLAQEAAETAAKVARQAAEQAARQAAEQAARQAAVRQPANATRQAAVRQPVPASQPASQLVILLKKYDPTIRYFSCTSADHMADAADRNQYIKNEAIASTIYNSYIRPLGQCKSLIVNLLLGAKYSKDDAEKLAIIEEKFRLGYKCSRKRDCMAGGGSSNTKITILGRKRNIIIQKGRQYVKVQGELMLLSKAEKLAKQTSSKKNSSTKQQPSSTKQQPSSTKQTTTKHSTSKQSTSKQTSLKQKK